MQHIDFNNVRFSMAFTTAKQLNKSTLPEISFAGRSNVGKSSLINKIFNRKSLAKVSSTPGKTASINFYDAGVVHFVDLPGYGYAQVSKSEKVRWASMIEGYFEQDRRFATVCTLVDIRHEASALDVDMVRFLNDRRLPYAVILTKADKIAPTKAPDQRDMLREQLGVPKRIPMFITSSSQGTGIEEVRAYFESLL